MAVAGVGSNVRVTINDTLAGVFDTRLAWGAILFENRSGSAQIRNVRIHPRLPIRGAPVAVIHGQDLAAAGGQEPELVRDKTPSYTARAMSARIEGVVQLEALVGADGSVRAVRITRRLHPDLDENAIGAMRAWKFKPGTFDGKAVGVIAEVDLKFTRH